MALGVGRLDGGAVPPLHPRLLQGRPVPRLRLGRPRRAQLRHEEGHGRACGATCPRTYGTFLICTLALIGIFPLAGFWSKDEILAGASQLGGDGGYPLMLVMGIIGALLHRGLHDPLRLPHVLRRAPGPRRRPHHRRTSPGPASSCRSTSSRAWPSSPASPTCPTPACCLVPDDVALRFEHYVEPVGGLLPDDRRTPSSRSWIALHRRRASALARHRPRLRSTGSGARSTGVTERSRCARAGYTLLDEQVLLRPPLHRRHRRRHQGPDRPGRLLVQPERHRRHRQRRRRRAPSASADWTYKYIDQGVVDGTVNGSGALSEASGQLLRRIQTGKVQQYGALLFGGAVVLAGIFVVRHLGRQTRPMEAFLDSWGLTLAVFLPLVGAAVMLLIPKDERGRPQGRSPSLTSPRRARRARRHRRLLRLRRRRHAPVRRRQGVDPGHRQPYHVGIDGISLPLLLLTGADRRRCASSTRGTTSPSPATPRRSSSSCSCSRRAWSARSSPRT